MTMKAAFVFFVCIVVACSSFNRVERNTIIRFKNFVGAKELKLFEQVYTNPFGEPFVVSKFRYYISNLSITDKSGKQINLPEQYYLINEDDETSRQISLPPMKGISAVSFVVGVDSLRNTSGVQTGSLDPANGMFWTWNSGYIFAKLEGQSDASHAPAHSFSWDIGGFRQQQNALRTIRLTIDPNNGLRGDTLTIAANLLKWFDGKTPLRISEAPVCHQPGKLAMQLADNYSTMFSVLP